MNSVFLGLGGNIGDTILTLKEAIARLKMLGNIEKLSSLYQTPPWGIKGQPDYLNGVVKLSYQNNPSQLLEEIQNIENQLGRVRGGRWQARTLDIDILYFGAEIVQTTKLTIPHPLLHLRKFVLIPLVEIEPDYTHPTIGKTNSELLATCPDVSVIHQLFVQNW